MYKYVYKGHDRIMYAIKRSDEEERQQQRRQRGEFVPYNEVKRYRDARYVTTSEAVWRTLQFTMSDMYPKVIRLMVHDEDEQQVGILAYPRDM